MSWTFLLGSYTSIWHNYPLLVLSSIDRSVWSIVLYFRLWVIISKIWLNGVVAACLDLIWWLVLLIPGCLENFRILCNLRSVIWSTLIPLPCSDISWLLSIKIKHNLLSLLTDPRIIPVVPSTLTELRLLLIRIKVHSWNVLHFEHAAGAFFLDFSSLLLGLFVISRLEHFSLLSAMFFICFFFSLREIAVKNTDNKTFRLSWWRIRSVP